MTYMENLEAHLKQLLTGTPEGERDIIIREMKRVPPVRDALLPSKECGMSAWRWS